ncbi:Glyoxalase/Bleomycin resistance protein/Dioxygenase superfamily protein [Marinomonas spartinae]|uniref:VOC family protein n=1 Tax=Marinomonas spartinae TaxID=1792290 RepID=UPI000808F460|nr:VOC family protein [Marinomonas spartinae]SBS29483.1 Glyoxalase/Bleomycin resistance protein/Dioxygenase superfamily protein [Marinomonas spartinae]
MNIIGLETLVFQVDDIEACHEFLTDYGLNCVNTSAPISRYEALDGTAIEICLGHHPTAPRNGLPSPSLIETIYAVEKQSDLDEIRQELEKDRQVSVDEHGVLHSIDDEKFALAFKITERRPIEAPNDLTNAPGHPAQRPVNQVAVDPEMSAKPRTLSHVVYFVNDADKAEAFYQRLGFRTTDKFQGVGPFMRPAGSDDHHCLFMIQTPPFVKGCEHFTFHMGSGTEVLVAGTRFKEKGYQSFWGPGRHLFGSNWFWYFNSPLGCHIEYDADMDKHDDTWAVRQAPMSADTSQLFLFSAKDKWAPGGAPPEKH